MCRQNQGGDRLGVVHYQLFKRAEEIIHEMVEVGMCRRKGACIIYMDIEHACYGRMKANKYRSRCNGIEWKGRRWRWCSKYVEIREGKNTRASWWSVRKV